MIRRDAITHEACIVEADGNAAGLRALATRVPHAIAVRADRIERVTLSGEHGLVFLFAFGCAGVHVDIDERGEVGGLGGGIDHGFLHVAVLTRRLDGVEQRVT